MSLLLDVERSLGDAARCREFFDALVMGHAALAREGNFMLAELTREFSHYALDAYFDHMSAAAWRVIHR